MSNGNDGFYGFSDSLEGANTTPDFQWVYSGTISTVQNNLLPVLSRSYNVYINSLDLNIQTPPQGQAVIVGFYAGGSLIQSVSIGPATSGPISTITPISPIFIPKNTLMTIQVSQVGTTVIGVTLTAYARIKRS